MVKMLIADDEAWIRERLRDTIDWNGMGVQVVGEACDGEEALAMCKSLCPDIIITDIRMPCIDGLEFIQRLRDSHDPVKVVIISGYSDFDYAQKAIKLGAYDYILKPVEDDDLLSVVKRCLEEIKEEESKNILIKRANEQMKESMPLLEEKFFLNLVNGFFRSEEDIHKELDFFGKRYRGLISACFIVQLDEVEVIQMSKEWNIHLLQFVARNIAEGFIQKLGNGESFFSQNGEVICLLFSKNEEKVLTRQIMSISNGIRKMFKSVTGHSTTIGIGRPCGSVMEIPDSYREAKEALQYKAYLGKDRIYDIGSIQIQHKPNYYKLYDMEILLNHVKMGNERNAVSVLNEMIQGIFKDKKDVSPIDLKFIFIDILNSVFKAVLETNSTIDDFSGFSLKFFEQLNKLQTIEEIHPWLTDTIVRIIDLLEKNKNSKRRKIIDKAVEYIDNHYKEPLTLNIVADRLFLNSSYFCKIFKDETGESFTKYLINLRIQKAKELMADPTVKIYEVAEMVGYDDVQYFSKIFKGIQGITPMQYREKIK